jgi:exodeoxyribonuclease VII large subunit
MTMAAPVTPAADAGSQRDILSVTQLNRKARQLLEVHLPMLWVEGELSNLARPSSGHWYFTLKDDAAQVRCAMFRNRAGLLRFNPKAGDKVLVRARVGLYEGRGDYQLIVEHMEEAGFGALQRAFEELRARLQQEGLFDEAHKQAIPELPRAITVITSPSGAAIRDILSVLKRRFPAIPVSILPVAVQGREAAPQIARAIELANEHAISDVLLLSRGGGSLEDLWAFNEEVVARAIYNSRIPIVSAVGHEVDFTIADFAADLRAPTPSAAAELLSPSQKAIAGRLSHCANCLTQCLMSRLQAWQDTLVHLRARLQHPGEKLRNRSQQLDHLELRLRRQSQAMIPALAQRIVSLQQRLLMVHPGRQIQTHDRQVIQLDERLRRQVELIRERKAQRLAKAAELLDSVSPLATLRRGYAIVQSGDRILRSCQKVAPGQEISARLNDGTLYCRVESTAPNAVASTEAAD